MFFQNCSAGDSRIAENTTSYFLGKYHYTSNHSVLCRILFFVPLQFTAYSLGPLHEKTPRIYPARQVSLFLDPYNNLRLIFGKPTIQNIPNQKNCPFFKIVLRGISGLLKIRLRIFGEIPLHIESFCFLSYFIFSPAPIYVILTWSTS